MREGSVDSKTQVLIRVGGRLEGPDFCTAVQQKLTIKGRWEIYQLEWESQVDC